LDTLFDATQVTYDFCSVLYDWETGEFSARVVKMFEMPPIGSNLLILDRLEILPEFRGRKIGLAVLYKAVQQFARGCGIVAMKPFPLQFDVHTKSDTARFDALKLADFNRESKTATKALEKYYKILGFRKLAGTPLCVLSPEFVNPKLADLALPTDSWLDM
jgi:GNAT superfamily N-acetyltransferase